MKIRRFNQFIFFFLIIFFVTIINFDSSQIKEKTIKNSYLNIPKETLEVGWNNGTSATPRTYVDYLGVIHAVWEDNTKGPWGTDYEIMYSSNSGSGWSNPIVISDGYNGNYWNNEASVLPDITIDLDGNIYVVWQDDTDGPWGIDYEIMYVNYIQGIGWSNVTVISDGYNGTYWNNNASNRPSIAVDQNGKVHVVWYDYTDGPWGNDIEIMYASNSGSGWSNATVISDDETLWNDGFSRRPNIAIETSGTIHVVWEDDTDGVWGNNSEIMYVSSLDGITFSNITVISDGYNGTYWNDGICCENEIVIDNLDNIHIVFDCYVGGIYGTDLEILYVSSSDGITWSNITVISDGYGGYFWNNDSSVRPDIAIDLDGNIHVVWHDDTNGPWGVDREIIYAIYSESVGWSNVTVISDDLTNWNNGDSFDPNIAIDSSGIIHVAWNDDTDGAWGNDTEIMYATYSESIGWSNVTVVSDRLIPFFIIPTYQNYFYINLVLSLISLGILWVLILINKKIQTGNYSIKTKQLTNLSIITGASLLIVPQVTQIQYNSSINLGENLLDSFIFVFPWIILIICILIILISLFSLLITLDEYKSYVRKKTIYSKPFHNISFEDIFENENRRKIIRYILAEPGIHYNDLQRKCFLTPGQIRWHLNILLEYNIIKKDRLGQYIVFSPNIIDLEYENYNKKVIRSKTSLDILDMIEENPGVIPSDLANNLDLKKSTISYHINKLKKKGFIYSKKEGRELRIFLFEK
ncbi:MAG: winged helix-turn-helix transcriptional regulator [Candidatus Lokiarchaeota archaeon]|nr:winged helix-turn-helix transcriptional regulator [Candidatus Lokiarchaeota archaeon]